MKTFVLAPDSFKESMSGKQVCQAMARGIRKVYADASIIEIPMADGGEGTVDSLIDAVDGKRVEMMVSGPLPAEKVSAYFGLLPDKNTAVIEMAKANGIDLLDRKRRNPLITSTYGTGELIKEALSYGVDKIIIGIGGSVTNDGGAGMAQALGAKFLDTSGKVLPFGGGSLAELATIDVSGLDARLADVEILVACDVTNPLTGLEGASYVFGPQKGATPKMVAQLDSGLKHYAQKIKEQLDRSVDDYPGAGAAGGLGAGLLAFTNATLKPGIDIVSDIIGLAEKIAAADYVFTGEGGMDYQTKFGKAPYGVAKLAKAHKKPLFALAGAIGRDVEVLYEEGMTAIFGILAQAESIEEALGNGPSNVERTCENIARTIHLFEQTTSGQ